MARAFTAPNTPALNTDGTLIPGAQWYFYQTGTTTLQTVYQDAALTVPHPNPVVADGFGFFPAIYLNPLGFDYKTVMCDASGNPISGRTQDPYPASDYSSAQIAANIGPALWPQTTKEKAANITPVSYFYPADPVADIRRYCTLTLDSSTDNTSQIAVAWTTLASYRGEVAIPYGAKFNKATVYGGIPVGVSVHDYSSVNTGQPPGYKNKTYRFITNNNVNDDSWTGNVDGHHAAIFLNNTGTSGSSSGNNRYRSIIRAAGFRWNNDDIANMQWVTSLSGRGTYWRTADVLLTSANFTFNYASRWTASTTYAAGSKMNTADGGAWLTVSGGTSSTTEPNGGAVSWQGTGYISGTTFTVSSTSNGAVAIGQAIQGTGVTADTRITGGSGSTWTVNNSQTIGASTGPVALQTVPTFTDGSVQWTWQGYWSGGYTRFYYDEDGYGAITCPFGGVARWGVDGAGSSGLSINYNQFTGDTYLRDDSRGVDIIRKTTTAGSYLGGVTSLQKGATLSGATPTISSTLHVVTNSVATNMTGITLPTGQTSGYVILFFSNANTTLKAANFYLKGNVDATPPANSTITLFLDSGLAQWTELARSF